MRRVAAASVILLVSFGVAVAEEFSALITKVEDNKVTFHKVKKGEKGDAMSLPVADNVKVTRGSKYNKDTKKYDVIEPVTGGIKAEALAKIPEAGVNARLTTDNGKITEIMLTKKGKGNK